MQTPTQEKPHTQAAGQAAANSKHAGTGRVIQVIGPTVDVRFDAGQLPDILTAIVVKGERGQDVTVEVAQHLGNNGVRCIALASTDGIVRGTEAVNTGKPISVPVGRETLGRMFNVLGQPIDEKPAPAVKKLASIHRAAPSLEERE